MKPLRRILSPTRFLLLLLLVWAQLAAAQQFVEHFRFGGAGQDSGKFNDPKAIALSDDGTLFIVDSRNNRIQLFTTDGKYLKSVGGFGFAPDQYDYPVDIWVKSLLNIYVCDYNNRRLQRYDRQMNYLAQLKSDPNWPEEYRFGEVLSCALNAQKDLFILDHQEEKVIKFNRTGQPERSFGTYESGAGELEEAVQLDIFRNRFVLVSDAGLKAIMVFDFFGTFIKSVTAQAFRHPSGLATHPHWGIFVADETAPAIFLIKPDLITVVPVNLYLQQELKHPRDIVLSTLPDSSLENNCFILDGNFIIGGKFTGTP